MEIEEENLYSFETMTAQLHITSPASVSNYNQYCIDELKKKYENKCYKGKYIQEVCKLLKRSKCYMTTNDAIGSGTIYMQFLAKLLIINNNTILYDCVIENIEESGRMQLKKNNIIIYIAGNRRFIILKKKQKINVLIKNVKYPIFEKYIITNGIPYFYPLKEDNVFHINLDSMNDIEKEEINKLKENIERLRKEQKKIGKKIWDVFYKRYYPFREEQVPPKEFKTKDIINISGKLSLFYPNTINYASGQILAGDFDKNLEESAYVIYSRFLNIHLKHLRLVIYMCSIYIDEEKNTLNKEVWELQLRLKI
jgi:hypothetical protein